MAEKIETKPEAKSDSKSAPKVASPSESKSDDSKSLIVKNAVGEYIRAKDLKVSSDLYGEDGLNGIIKKVLDDACKRCTGNNRKTVMKQDL